MNRILFNESDTSFNVNSDTKEVKELWVLGDMISIEKIILSKISNLHDTYVQFELQDITLRYYFVRHLDEAKQFKGIVYFNTKNLKPLCFLKLKDILSITVGSAEKSFEVQLAFTSSFTEQSKNTLNFAYL